MSGPSRTDIPPQFGSEPIGRFLLRWGSIITFLVGAGIAISVAGADYKFVKQQKRAILDRQALVVENEFKDRVSLYRQLLRVGEALMAHDVEMTPEEWHTFVKTLNLYAFYPGIERFVVVKYTAHDYKASFIARQILSNPAFSLIPQGDRPDYMVITRAENLTDYRNIVGYDIGSDETRRKTAELARDTGEATLTPPVRVIMGRDGQNNIPHYIYYARSEEQRLNSSH